MHAYFIVEQCLRSSVRSVLEQNTHVVAESEDRVTGTLNLDLVDYVQITVAITSVSVLIKTCLEIRSILTTRDAPAPRVVVTLDNGNSVTITSRKLETTLELEVRGAQEDDEVGDGK